MAPKSPSTIDITGGPSKFDLMISLLHGEQGERTCVLFSLDFSSGAPSCQALRETSSEGGVGVVINSLAREDGSDWKFVFDGFIPLRREDGFPRVDVHGFFSVHTRTGWIEEANPE